MWFFIDVLENTLLFTIPEQRDYFFNSINDQIFYNSGDC